MVWACGIQYFSLTDFYLWRGLVCDVIVAWLCLYCWRGALSVFDFWPLPCLTSSSSSLPSFPTFSCRCQVNSQCLGAPLIITIVSTSLRSPAEYLPSAMSNMYFLSFCCLKSRQRDRDCLSSAAGGDDGDDFSSCFSLITMYFSSRLAHWLFLFMVQLAMTEVCNSSAKGARWLLKFCAPVLLENIYQVFKGLSLNGETGGEGHNFPSTNSYFPGEVVIMTLLRFAGARQ